jgi:RNAse (barnase) inhibitor barstar
MFSNDTEENERIYTNSSRFIKQCVNGGVHSLPSMMQNEKLTLCAYFIEELDNEYFIDLCVQIDIQKSLARAFVGANDTRTFLESIFQEVLKYGQEIFDDLFKYHVEQLANVAMDYAE